MGRTETETRARLPDQSGYVERDTVRVRWDAYGTGDRALLLLPTWSMCTRGCGKRRFTISRVTSGS